MNVPDRFRFAIVCQDKVVAVRDTVVAVQLLLFDPIVSEFDSDLVAVVFAWVASAASVAVAADAVAVKRQCHPNSPAECFECVAVESPERSPFDFRVKMN